MMINIKKYQEQDLDEIMEMNQLVGLRIQWDNAFPADKVLVARDEKEKLIGLGGYIFDGSWAYLDRDDSNLKNYMLKAECFIDEKCVNKEEIDKELLKALVEQFKEYKKQYPNKELILRSWSTNGDMQAMQKFLELGFAVFGATPVLAFDLTKEIPNYSIPENITICEHSFEDGGMQRYMKANELGYVIQDNEAEMWFMQGDESNHTFTALNDEGEIVASAMTWRIGMDGHATENVFTIPGYRRQNIARQTIATTLRFQKEQGAKETTLSVLGTNLSAIKTYLSMGFFVKYCLMEYRYTI